MRSDPIQRDGGVIKSRDQIAHVTSFDRLAGCQDEWRFAAIVA
jgi:hypothetical protein